MRLFTELRRLPFLLPLFLVLTVFMLTPYINRPILMTRVGTLTSHIIHTHGYYLENKMNGGQLQRRLIPELAEGTRQIIDHSPILQRVIQVAYGRDHGVPSIVFGYWWVHLIFGFFGMIGIYWFGRVHLAVSPLSALGLTLLFQVYETFALAGFVTGRWTDISIPALMIWAMHFLLSGRISAYFLIFAVLSVVRESAMYLLPFIGLLWIFKVPGFDFKNALSKGILTLLVLVTIRGTLIYLYPGARFSDESSSMLESLWVSLQNNLHDSNMIKVPVAMHNLLWILAFVGWSQKPPHLRAITLLGLLIFGIQLMMGSAGESWGRDLPVLLCFLISSWYWIDQKLQKSVELNGLS